MDANRFDALARALRHPRSRRSLTRLLGTLAFGGGVSRQTVQEALAATLIGGSSCRRDSQCKTGTCLDNNLCSCSAGFPKCKQPTNPCKKAVCNRSAQRCELTNKRNGIACGDGKVCYRGTCCTPTCDNKQCGTNGCGGSCGSCVAPETCRSGRCSCGFEQDLCGGVCRPACPDAQIYDPTTCICCHPNGTVFATNDVCLTAGCCAGNDHCRELTDGTGRYACRGRFGGDPCTFDAQCASGQCIFELGTGDRSCL